MNTYHKKHIPVDLIEKYFRIDEDGAVFSYRKNKYLKPTFNTSGHLYVLLPVPAPDYYLEHDPARNYAIHRLVAAKYLGQCPDGKETSHKDGNKTNNHYTNLEYITHSENQLKAFREHGRVSPPGHKGPFSDKTKELMSNAKIKAVVCLFNGEQTVFPSIDIAAKELISYRKDIYNAIHKNQPLSAKSSPFKGAKITFL